MKVLLINPLTTEEKLVNISPNIGLGYIATSLRKNGFQVEIWDGIKKGLTIEKLNKRLKITDYDVAGFQIFTRSVKGAQEGLKVVKTFNPKAITIVGGPHPSGDPEGSMNYLMPDFAFRGEAEEGLPKLLKKLNGSVECQYNDIPNLIWRKNGAICCNPLQPIKDLDSLGLPSWDLINPNDYPFAPIGAFVKRTTLTSLSTTRGCPHFCTFCANNTIMGRGLRARSKESVLDEMELLYHNYGIREFQIIDDNFTFKKSLVMGVCKGIIEKGMGVHLSFPNGLRLSTLDEEVLQILEKAGCYSAALGIESGSQRSLNNMKKKQTVTEIKEKVNLIRRVTKIRMTGAFVIGFPWEEEEDILETIKLSLELPLNRAQFTVLLPLPGSEIYNELKAEGKLDNIDFSDYIFSSIIHVPPKMTLNQLIRLRKKAFLKFYLRPKILWGLLTEIHSVAHLKYIFRRVMQLIS